MDFMISLFGSEHTGKPKPRRRVIGDSSSAGPPGKISAKQSNGSSSSSTDTIRVGGSALLSLPPEDEEGNVEYKLKLINPSPSRFEHLVTQLKWRLREGQGEAIYEIGVADNGILSGLTPVDMQASLHTLHRMAERLKATVAILRERMVDDESELQVAEVLVRRVPEHQDFIDLRVAVLGCADAGKSTLLGVITQGEMDNGRGRARLNLFRHLHEIQSGRTSSISLDLVGFDTGGGMITQRDYSVEEILHMSSKLLTLIDLAGHQKFIKTTIFGLTGYRPHFAMLVVAANMGIVGTTREHMGLALALGVPFFIVVTKVDLVKPAVLAKTLTQLEALVKSPGCIRVPSRVHSMDDVISLAAGFNAEKTVPIFCVSSVTGDNLDLLTAFFNVLPASQTKFERQAHLQELIEFRIDEIFNVQNSGTVAAGLLSKGIIRENDECLIGPDPLGHFVPVRVTSIHRNKAPCRVVKAGQAASLALLPTVGDMEIRKGMAVLDARSKARACLVFEADVYLLYHPAQKLCSGFQSTVHIGNVCQTATIIKMNKKCLKTNDSGLVKFKFYRSPEYVTVGSRILFREGRTKGIGKVTRVFYAPG